MRCFFIFLFAGMILSGCSINQDRPNPVLVHDVDFSQSVMGKNDDAQTVWKTYENSSLGFSFRYPESAYHPTIALPPDAGSGARRVHNLIVIEDPSQNQVFLAPSTLAFWNGQKKTKLPTTMENLRMYERLLASDINNSVWMTGTWTIHTVRIMNDQDLESFYRSYGRKYTASADPLDVRWEKTALSDGSYAITRYTGCKITSSASDLPSCRFPSDIPKVKYNPKNHLLVWWDWSYTYFNDSRFWKAHGYTGPSIEKDFSKAYDKEILESFHWL